MILGLYPEEGSDLAVNAPEVNIPVFMLLLSLMAEDEAATESGHRGRVGFLRPAKISVFILHTNQSPIINHIRN